MLLFSSEISSFFKMFRVFNCGLIILFSFKEFIQKLLSAEDSLLNLFISSDEIVFLSFYNIFGFS